MTLTILTTVDLAVAQQVRAARTRAGMTQAAVADRLDVSTGAVRAIEHGRRRVSVTELALLSQVLDVDVHTLLDIPARGHPGIDIVPSAVWRSEPAWKRYKQNTIVVHHSGVSHTRNAAEDFDYVVGHHEHVRWKCSYAIHPDGTIFDGGSGADIGVFFLGAYRDQCLTVEALDAFRRLRQWLVETTGRLAADHEVVPHNSVCPGPNISAVWDDLASLTSQPPLDRWQPPDNGREDR